MNRSSVVSAVHAMPTASASEYYLLPDNSSVANPGDCTTVSVTLNATHCIRSRLFNITYDSTCADMVCFTCNDLCFVDPPTVAIVPGRLTCDYANMPGGMPIISPCTSGLVHLGDFEICCNMTTLPGQTVLKFDTGRDGAVTSLDALMILRAGDQEGYNGLKGE